MNRLQLITRVRSYTRDFSNSIFREADIIDYINEGINRFKQRIPEFKGMVKLTSNNQDVVLLPEEYHELLSVYASARCFAQDEREYKATTLMNEFETKLEELKSDIEAGIVVIIDSEGTPVVVDNDVDYVDLSYWKTSTVDIDTGVEGVE